MTIFIKNNRYDPMNYNSLKRNYAHMSKNISIDNRIFNGPQTNCYKTSENDYTIKIAVPGAEKSNLLVWQDKDRVVVERVSTLKGIKELSNIVKSNDSNTESNSKTEWEQQSFWPENSYNSLKSNTSLKSTYTLYSSDVKTDEKSETPNKLNSEYSQSLKKYNKTYVWRTINAAPFVKQFRVSPKTTIVSAKLDNGILSINLHQSDEVDRDNLVEIM